MHDSLALERRGVPTALLLTEPFVRTAELSAQMAGTPGYPFAVLVHPINRLSGDELTERARAAIPHVLKLLLNPRP